MGFIGKYCEGSYWPTPYLTFGLSPGDLGKDGKKKMQIKRKCRKEDSFAFIAFSRKQVSAHPHQGCACAGCLKYNYTPQCGLAGLHSPPSVTFIAKLLCFQGNIMGLQPNVLPSSHWSLVWNKCEHCLINPLCGPWREVASNIPSILQWRKERQSKLLTLNLCPAFWTFPSGYPAGLSNSTYLKLSSFSPVF